MGESKRRQQIDLSYGAINIEKVAELGINHGLSSLKQAAHPNTNPRNVSEVICVFSNQDYGVPEQSVSLIINGLLLFLESNPHLKVKVNFTLLVTRVGDYGPDTIRNARKILEVSAKTGKIHVYLKEEEQSQPGIADFISKLKRKEQIQVQSGRI